jgi:hypothetical protein
MTTRGSGRNEYVLRVLLKGATARESGYVPRSTTEPQSSDTEKYT